MHTSDFLANVAGNPGIQKDCALQFRSIYIVTVPQIQSTKTVYKIVMQMAHIISPLGRHQVNVSWAVHGRGPLRSS